MATRATNASTHKTPESSRQTPPLGGFFPLDGLLNEEERLEAERKTRRRAKSAARRALAEQGGLVSSHHARRAEEQQAQLQPEEQQAQPEEQAPDAAEEAVPEEADEAARGDSEPEPAQRRKKRKSDGAPEEGTSELSTVALKAAFKSRSDLFQSVSSQLKAAEDKAKVAGEKDSELTAVDVLLKAEKDRHGVLQKTVAKAKGGPKEHFQFLKSELADSASRIKKLNTRITSLKRVLKKADAKHQRAVEKRDRALTDLAKADGAILKAVLSTVEKVTEKSPVKPKPSAAAQPARRVPPADPPGGGGAGRDILRLQKRNVELDLRVRRAIAEVVARAKTPRSKVIERLRNLVVVTQVEQVVRAIDRRRLSDARREVLDEVLPVMLNQLMDRYGDEFRRYVKDSVGFADYIVSQLDKQHGPIDLVTAALADLVIKERGLETSKRGDLVKYLRRSFEESRT